MRMQALIEEAKTRSDGYDQQFFDGLQRRLRALSQREARGIHDLEVEPLVTVDGERFRFVRVHLNGQEARPYTWHQPV